jgi:hypothetical protein
MIALLVIMGLRRLVNIVNDGRKLTPWRRLKVDPLLLVGSLSLLVERDLVEVAAE